MKRNRRPALVLIPLAIIMVIAYSVKQPVAIPVSQPKRIISIVPSCTEMLFAVGAGDLLVGVTTYCTYPPEAMKIQKIGDMTLNYEAILSLKPDVVVSSADLAAKANAQLASLGVNVVCIDPRDLAGIPAAMRMLGVLTGHEPQAEQAAGDVEKRIAAISVIVGTAKTRPSVYMEASSQPHAAAPGMTAHEVIERAGGRNVITESFAGKWVPISWEAVLSRDPEVIVIAHDETPGPETRPGWKDLSAVKAGRVHVINKDYFVYPTPRLVMGFEKLARLLHPECFDAKNP